jgi:GT2 family glycosyltransferase
MKLAICVPISWDWVPTPFLISYAALFRPSVLRALSELGVSEFWQLFNRAFPLDLNRNRLVHAAQELGADLLLFLDADMVFPQELIPRLIQGLAQAGEKTGILSALYFKKAAPHQPVPSWKNVAADEQLMNPIWYGPDRRSVGCDVVGMGATLIRREVFEAVAPPWFEYERYQKTGETTVTEDVSFCRKVKAASFEIVVDPSLVCGHLSSRAIEERHWLCYRDQVFNPDGRLRQTEARA